jgi:hypothetical protein
MGASKDPNAKVTILLVSPETRRPVLAVKVPTTDAAARAVQAEGRILAGLEGLSRRMIATIPSVVDTVEFQGRVGIVMTARPGTPMTTAYLRPRHIANPRRVARHFSAAGEWLAEFQRETAAPLAPLDMDGGVATRLATRFADDEQVPDDLRRLAEIHARLASNAVPRTGVHGDLWFGNVLVSGADVSGIVDWEAGAKVGEPTRDIVRFAIMYALFLDRGTRAGRRVAGHPDLRPGRWGAGLHYALDGRGWFPDLFRRFVEEGLDRLGASPAAWRDAVLAGIAEVAALTDDPEFARATLTLYQRVIRADVSPRPPTSARNKKNSTENWSPPGR